MTVRIHSKIVSNRPGLLASLLLAKFALFGTEKPLACVTVPDFKG